MDKIETKTVTDSGTIRNVSNEACLRAAKRMADVLTTLSVRNEVLIYGIPRGGIPVAYLLQKFAMINLANSPEQADVIVDDVIGTGATRTRYQAEYPSKPFLTLGNNLDPPKSDDEWLVFPWERTEDGHDESATDIVTRLLDYVGEDASREGLKETPKRVLKAWSEWTAGYGQDPADVMKVFADGAESYDEMVTVKNIPFYSMCEHHMAPFFGTATISYLPDKKVIGLSKLSRVLQIFSRRLQVQERITTQVVQALQDGLNPLGVGVLLKARHLCMESRGISQQGSETITTGLRGKFLTDPEVRAEFLAAAK